MQKKLKLQTLFLQIFLLFVLHGFAQVKTQISVRSETAVKDEIVKLGDIADISGNEENSKRIKDLSLGYSPNIGMTRTISHRKIKLVIAAAGFSTNQVLLNSPETIYIRRKGQDVEGAKIREVVEKTILRRFENNAVEVRISKLEFPEAREVPLGKIEIITTLANVRNIFAPFSLPLEIRVDDRIVQSMSVNVEIEAFAEVFVAAKDLFTNMRILETELVLEKRRIEKPLSQYLREKEKLRGIKLVRDIPNGAVLTADSFVADIVIKTGDLVRIVGQSARLRISINGEARASGRIGDRISVKNLQSDQLLQATIIDEGLVKVIF